MDLISHYNSVIVEGFDRYHIPDLNLETAKIVFFLESGHFEEVPHKLPLCGKSGINFSDKLFNQDSAYGLWEQRPLYVGILESSSYPLQIDTYREVYKKDKSYPISENKVEKIADFEIVRKYIYKLPKVKTELILNSNETLPEYILQLHFYKDYCYRVKKLIDVGIVENIVVCGLFAQLFFNSYLSQNNITVVNIQSYGTKKNTGEINISNRSLRLIYINHPEEWFGNNYFRFMKSTVEKIKEIITKLKGTWIF